MARITDGDGAGFGCHKQIFLKISTGVTRLFGSLARAPDVKVSS